MGRFGPMTLSPASDRIRGTTNIQAHALDGTSYHTVLSDTTLFNATTTAHGLLIKLGGNTSKYLASDGSWTEPAGTLGAAHALDSVVVHTAPTGASTIFNATSTQHGLIIALSGNATELYNGVGGWNSPNWFAPVSGSTVYAPESGSTIYAPITGSTLYAPITGSTIYAGSTNSTSYVHGTSTQFVPGTSTDFTVWGSSTNYAPITGSTIYVSGQATDYVGGSATQFAAYLHPIDSTVYHSTGTDVSVHNVSTLLHGFAPKMDGASTSFLSGAGTWIGVPHVDTTLISHALDSTVYHGDINDTTKYNVSTAAHGFTPKGSGVAGEFLNSSGGWSTPAGIGGGTTTHALDSTAIHTISNTTVHDFGVATHGFVPLGGYLSSKFLQNAGGWAQVDHGDLLGLDGDDHSGVYSSAGHTHVASTLISHTVDSSIYHAIAVDITDHNVSTLRHGFMAKLGGFSSKFFNDAGSMSEISTAVYSSAGHAHAYAPGSSTDYAPFTASTAYVNGQSTDMAVTYAPITGSTLYVAGQSSDFVSGSATQFAVYLHPIDSTVYHSTGTDVTVHNVSTLLHGFMPKLGGLSSKFFTDAGTMVELSTAVYSTAGHTHAYAPITGSTVYVPGQTTDFSVVAHTHTTVYAGTNLTKTITLYADAGMIATSTYAILGQALTTANNINYTYAEYSTVAGERLQWGVEMDEGWNSSNLYATFLWTAPLTTKAGDVQWALSGIRIGDGSTIQNATAGLCNVVDTFQGSSLYSLLHKTAETTNFVVTGAGNYITFELTRSTVSDTLSTAARIIAVKLRGTYASTY